jgi:hypothetical protein
VPAGDLAGKMFVPVLRLANSTIPCWCCLCNGGRVRKNEERSWLVSFINTHRDRCERTKKGRGATEPVRRKRTNEERSTPVWGLRSFAPISADAGSFTARNRHVGQHQLLTSFAPTEPSHATQR